MLPPLRLATALLPLLHLTTSSPLPAPASFDCGAIYTAPNFTGNAAPLWLAGSSACLNVALPNISSLRVTDRHTTCDFFATPNCAASPSFAVTGPSEMAQVSPGEGVGSYSCVVRPDQNSSPRAAANAYATHLYKLPDLGGAHLDIRADTVCINLYNVYGGWDRAVRSLEVAEGKRCGFYGAQDCRGNSFEMGSGVLNLLSQVFDGALSSVQCCDS